MSQKPATKNIKCVSGFRDPTDEEAEGIARFTGAKYDHDIKITQRTAVCLFAAAIVFFLCAVLDDEYQFVSVFLALGSALMGAVSLSSIKVIQKKKQAFENRQYEVASGTVWDIQANPDKVGCCNVMFRDENGTIYTHWMVVRGEGVEDGSPMLLVRADPSVMEGEYNFAFTPFMLTPKGAKLHW